MQHYHGDLEEDNNFASALAARAHTSAVGREVLLFVVDVRHVKWAQNLLLNLAELGLPNNALGIGQSRDSCEALLARVPAGTVSCGHSSFMRHGANATVTKEHH